MGWCDEKKAQRGVIWFFISSWECPALTSSQTIPRGSTQSPVITGHQHPILGALRGIPWRYGETPSTLTAPSIGRLSGGPCSEPHPDINHPEIGLTVQPFHLVAL